MTRKKRQSRYSIPPNATQEKFVDQVSVNLLGLRMIESSEVSPESMRSEGVAYEHACMLAGLTPNPEGWGLLHCEALDGRNRFRRVTLATPDLTYHRTFHEVASRKNRGHGIELAFQRYPFHRLGWPGPTHQGGSWKTSEGVSWNPSYRGACPEIAYLDHFHAIQATTHDAFREICVVFAQGNSGAKWTMLDDEPINVHAQIAILEHGIFFSFPPGISVAPGWPIRDIPSPCSSLACLDVSPYP
ncbi:hypothetical protein [Streptomyces sp. NPDC059076]|uniref:hypothetical protein n=1 Tax=unclassified Streptomyces TaxID=2593676 RepID=UPI0036C154E8